MHVLNSSFPVTYPDLPLYFSFSLRMHLSFRTSNDHQPLCKALFAIHLPSKFYYSQSEIRLCVYLPQLTYLHHSHLSQTRACISPCYSSCATNHTLRNHQNIMLQKCRITPGLPQLSDTGVACFGPTWVGYRKWTVNDIDTHWPARDLKAYILKLQNQTAWILSGGSCCISRTGEMCRPAHTAIMTPNLLALIKD